MPEKITFVIAVFVPIGLCVAGCLIGCLLECFGNDALAGTTALGCLAALGVVVWLIADTAVPKQPLRDALMLWLTVLLLGGLVGSLAMIGAALTDCTPIVILVAIGVLAGVVWLFVHEYNTILKSYEMASEVAKVAIRILQA